MPSTFGLGSVAPGVLGIQALELPEQLLALLVDDLGHDDRGLHEEVAGLGAPEGGHASPLEAEDLPAGGAGRYLEPRATGERGHLHARTECGLLEGDGPI